MTPDTYPRFMVVQVRTPIYIWSGENRMTDKVERRFRRELNSFFGVTLLNVVFGAQAIAIGIAYVVAAVSGTSGVPADPALRVLAGALAFACFGLGLAWVRSSAVVLRGVALIRRPFRRRKGPASEEEVTRGIVQMVAHYRENRATVRTMILVCIAGGFFFLVQGLVSALESASLSLSAGNMTLNAFALIPAAVLSLGIGLVGLLSAYYFNRFSRSWDLRLEETARAEARLKSAMEMETE
jgi:hypothetical protein